MTKAERDETRFRQLVAASQRGTSKSAMPITERQTPHRKPTDHVIGHWPRGGSRRLFVRELEPAQPPAGYGDLWVDISGLEDDATDIVEVTPYNNTVRMGSAVTLDDGRVLYVWADETAIRQGHSNNVEDYLTLSGTVAHDRDLFTQLVFGDGSSAWPAVGVARDGGRLLLTTYWWSQDGDLTARGRVYESEDEAQSWQFLAEYDTLDISPGDTIYNEDGFGIYSADHTTVGPPRRLRDGSLVAVLSNAATSRLQFGETWAEVGVWRSTDGGRTWARRHHFTGGLAYAQMTTRAVGGIDDELYVSDYFSGWDHHTRLYRSTDFGSTWTEANLIEGLGRASAHVAPEMPSPSGWTVLTVNSYGTLRRWLAPDPADPFDTWTEVATEFEFSGGSAGFEAQPLLDSMNDVLVMYWAQHVGQAFFVAPKRAQFFVLTQGGEWVLIAGDVVIDHDHREYAKKEHEHFASELDLVLADMGDVESGPEDGDVLVYDADDGLWKPAPIPKPWHVGPDPPADPEVGDFWVDASGTP